MKREFQLFNLGMAAFAAVLLFSKPTIAATITWTNSVDGNWSGTTNWSPNQVPGSSDTAVITNDGTYTVTLDVGANVAGLVVGATSGVNTQTFLINGQTLTLNGQVMVNSQGLFNFSNGTLAGNGILAGVMTWTGGTLAGGGTLTVATNGVLNLSGSGPFNLSGMLTNAGTVNWEATADLAIYYAEYYGLTGGIVNLSGAVFNAQNDQAITAPLLERSYNTSVVYCK